MKVKIIWAVLSAVVLGFGNVAVSAAQTTPAAIVVGAGASPSVTFDPSIYNGGPMYVTIRVYPGNDGYTCSGDQNLYSKYPGNSNGGNYTLINSKTPGYTSGYWGTGWNVSIAQGTGNVYWRGEATPYKTVFSLTPYPHYDSYAYLLAATIGPFFGYPQ